MKFNRKRLVEFYDDKNHASFKYNNFGGHVSAITGLIGEDLLIAILFHYWRNQKSLGPKLLTDPCIESKENGQRGRKKLDAWLVCDDKTIFQVEIKNWSAYSKNGDDISVDCDDDNLKKYAIKRWDSYFGVKGMLPDQTEKVWLTMVRPADYKNHTLERMLLFWFPICDKELSPMSIFDDPKKGRLHVFSASIYLRSLSDDFINVEDADISRIKNRVELLDALIQR